MWRVTSKGFGRRKVTETDDRGSNSLHAEVDSDSRYILCRRMLSSTRYCSSIEAMNHHFSRLQQCSAFTVTSTSSRCWIPTMLAVCCHRMTACRIASCLYVVSDKWDQQNLFARPGTLSHFPHVWRSFKNHRAADHHALPLYPLKPAESPCSGDRSTYAQTQRA